MRFLKILSVFYRFLKRLNCLTPWGIRLQAVGVLGIRTPGLFVPNEARYQAAPYSEVVISMARDILALMKPIINRYAKKDDF